MSRVTLISPEPELLANSLYFRLLVSEFPSIGFDVCSAQSVSDTDPPTAGQFDRLTLSSEAWRHPALDLRKLDAQVATRLLRPGTIAFTVSGAADTAAPTCLEVLTRYQRFIERTNQYSRAPLFDRIRERHRSLYDSELPLVRADYDHALDTWQWLLRLDPSASLAVQVAALFHDIERLTSEAIERVEHRAPDYERFKENHARLGAAITHDIIADLPIDPATRERIGYLVEQHEKPCGQPELSLLNDADALSFFSLNSDGYLDYYGTEQTRRKIAYTLGRMSRDVRYRLGHIRYREDVHLLLREQLERDPVETIRDRGSVACGASEFLWDPVGALGGAIERLHEHDVFDRPAGRPGVQECGETSENGSLYPHENRSLRSGHQLDLGEWSRNALEGAVPSSRQSRTPRRLLRA